jgi:hypothetical protein
MLFDQLERERVVSSRHRVCGEDGRAADFFDRRVEARALFGEIANALQDDKGGVAFVQMEHARVEPIALKVDAADPENDFLLDPRPRSPPQAR